MSSHGRGRLHNKPKDRLCRRLMSAWIAPHLRWLHSNDMYNIKYIYIHVHCSYQLLTVNKIISFLLIHILELDQVFLVS